MAGEVERILKPLNEAQLEAVLSFGQPLLVLAGPGAGKTRVIVHKIAYLLWKKPIPFKRILAVTFTNKAAGEMKERVHSLVGTAENVDLMTFHAFGARLLRRYSGIKTIYDRDDSIALIKRIMKDFGWSRQDKASAIMEKISRAKSKLIYPWDESGLLMVGMMPDEADLYAEYQKRIESSEAADFDDLIAKTVLLLQERPDIAEYLRNLYGYILVDEFQDTSPNQYEILKLISGINNICVVGDEDQSIYSWRGATMENIFKFESDFRNVKIVILDLNYRSLPAIVKAASSMISRNRYRHEKKLRNVKEGDLPIFFRKSYSREDEAEFVGVLIERLISKKEFLPVAVFYRANYQSRLIEESLALRGIGYKILGSTGFFDRREVKDPIAYLRIIANPEDSVALFRALHHIPRGIGKATDELIVQRIRDGFTPLEAVSAVSLELKGKRGKALKDFLELLNKSRRVLLEEGIGAALRYIVEESGFRDYLREIDPSGAREENVDELLRMGEEAQSAGVSLDDFLERASLTTSMDQAAGDVVLSTLHAAKGLEFESVIIVTVDEGFIPHSKVVDAEGIEEERRLLYVGMTRAKKLLVISSATFMPSQFLSAIPEELVRRIEFPEDILISSGSRVSHPVLGEGEIISRENGRITVRLKDGRVLTFIEDMVDLKFLD